MRVQVICAMLAAGCGRIGFDALPGAGGGAYHKSLAIDHVKVSGELADFPVLVELHDPDLAAHARADGHDIAFLDQAQLPLAYERELYSVSPPALIAWVKVPLVSATADPVIEMVYGDPAASDQARPPEVWTNGFVAVHHFGDGVTFDAHDSTGKNDGTNQGATAASGKIAGAIQLDNPNDTANNVTSTANGLDTSTGALNTVTFWVDYTGAPGKGTFAFVAANNEVYDLWFQADGCEGFNTEGGGVLATTATGLRNAWHHIAAVFYNGVPDAQRNQLYIDGQRQTLTTSCGGVPANPRTVGGTAAWGGNTEVSASSNYQMTGYLDEGHLANTARSPEWIQTEFSNQADPTGFVASGPEQVDGAN